MIPSEKSEKKSKKKYKDYFELLEVYVKFNKFTKAAKIAEKLLKDDAENKKKNNALLHVVLAHANLAENKTDDMKENLKKAKDLDEKNRKGFYEMAVCVEMKIFFDKKEWENLLKVWKDFKALKFKVKDKQKTLWYPMMAYYNDKDWKNCEKLLKDIYKDDKKSEKGKKALEMLMELKEKDD